MTPIDSAPRLAVADYEQYFTQKSKSGDGSHSDVVPLLFRILKFENYMIIAQLICHKTPASE
jgi:hypothetical protein